MFAMSLSSSALLRRVFRLAAQWGAIDVAPLVKMLPGELLTDDTCMPADCRQAAKSEASSLVISFKRRCARGLYL